MRRPVRLLRVRDESRVVLVEFTKSVVFADYGECAVQSAFCVWCGARLRLRAARRGAALRARRLP